MRRAEYINVNYAGVEYTDERNIAEAEAPEAVNVLVIGYDELVILTGTQPELILFAMKLWLAAAGPATAYSDVDPVLERAYAAIQEVSARWTGATVKATDPLAELAMRSLEAEDAGS